MVLFPSDELQLLVKRLHESIRFEVRRAVATRSSEELAAIVRHGAGDTTFGIDVPAEALVERAFSDSPVRVSLTCEGLGHRVFGPSGGPPWHVLMDPLDGSRELALDKRSAWILSGIAPPCERPTLGDITWALQTEVPASRQASGVTVTAAVGKGAVQEEWDLRSGSRIPRSPTSLSASRARSVRGGFAVFIDYFAGHHALTGLLADKVLSTALQSSRGLDDPIFNDQYLSTAGVLYCLASGKYRFAADVRPLIDLALAQPTAKSALCAHPYDLAAFLVATEAGVILRDPAGHGLQYPFDTVTDCSYVAFANDGIQAEMERTFFAALDRLPQLARALGSIS